MGNAWHREFSLGQTYEIRWHDWFSFQQLETQEITNPWPTDNWDMASADACMILHWFYDSMIYVLYIHTAKYCDNGIVAIKYLM